MVWRCPSVRSSVRPSVPTVSTKKHRCNWQIFFKFDKQVCLRVPSINLLFVLSYLIKYAQNSKLVISAFLAFMGWFFKLEPSNFVHFENLSCSWIYKFRFLPYSNMAVFMIILAIYLLISLGTLLARENIEGTVWFFQIRYADVIRWSLDWFIVLF